jgi:hypothetical protein
VELIAGGVLEVGLVELVVLDDGVPVPADPQPGPLARPVRVGVDVGPAGADRRRRNGSDRVEVDRPERVAFLLDLRPRFLRDDQDAGAEPRHDLGGLRGNGGRVHPVAERPDRPRAQLDPGLPDDLAVELHDARLQGAHDGLGRLLELLAGRAHVGPEGVELDLAGAAAHAQDEAAAGEVVQHEDLLGQAERVVPGQHGHHRTQPDLLGAGGHVGEELHHVRAHRVPGEVMLQAPDGLEAERLGEIRHRDVRLVYLVVRHGPAVILERDAHSDMHGNCISSSMSRRQLVRSNLVKLEFFCIQ